MRHTCDHTLAFVKLADKHAHCMAKLYARAKASHSTVFGNPMHIEHASGSLGMVVMVVVRVTAIEMK